MSDVNTLRMQGVYAENGRSQAQTPTTVGTVDDMRKLIVISGLPIDDLNMDEALDRIESFIKIGRETGKTHQIATVNADFVVKASKDPELRYLLQEADMATADGMPLVWGARLLGVILEGRVAGADMVPALAERAAAKGYSIYFLGAGPGIAAQAVANLKAKYPDLPVAGVVSPPYSSVLEMDRSILDEIKAADPDVLLVAFGNPKQEKWIGMYGRELGVPVMIGVGGTLDFIAGHMKRAPEWMQNSGLEWLFRLLQEPKRMWRRYVVDMFGFSTFFARQWWTLRHGNMPAPLLPTTTDIVMVNDTAVLNVKGRLDVSNVAAFNAKAQQALAETPYLIVNLAEADFLDSSAFGTLIGLTKQARDAGGDLCLAAVPEPIYQALSMIRLDRFFTIYEAVTSGMSGQTIHHQAHVAEPVAMKAESRFAVVKIPRRLDAVTAEEVAATCTAVLEKNPYLVLDFSDTVFLASAGLAVLARLNRLAQEKKGELRVASYSADVYSVIEMVRFDKVLTLYRDVEAAMA